MSRLPANFAEPAARLWKDTVALVSRWTGRLRPQPVANPCPHCGVDLTDKPRYREFFVCDNCGRYFPYPARARVLALSDPGTFTEFVSPLLSAYRSRWAFSRPVYRATRRRQSVLTGTANVAGTPVVFIVFDFAMYGGTMSVAAGERIARAFAHAQDKGLPVVAVTASGGVRIQEGIPALLQMARTIQAVNDFRQAHRPFIALVTNPTTGGVYASFTSLADMIFAEPNTIMGFAGPRVAEAAMGKPLPANSHSAQAAYEHGMIDGILTRESQRDFLARVLAYARPEQPAVLEPRPLELPKQEHPADHTLAMARNPDRPTSKDYLERLFTDCTELHGDRLFGDDPTVVAGLARFEDITVALIALRREGGSGKPLGPTPAGYHKSERMIHLAGELRLPVVTLIDTIGADPGYDSERFGIAGAIAHCMSTFLLAPPPTISVIVGEATSGGALALAAADRVLMQENAVYPVISPEGASAILYGNASRASDTLGILGITVDDLFPRGIIDTIIPEPEEGAQTNIDAAAAYVKVALHNSLAELLALSNEERLSRRRQRYLSSAIVEPSTSRDQ